MTPARARDPRDRAGSGEIRGGLGGQMAEGPPPIARPAVERTLGKLVMDADFRESFFRDPPGTLRAADLDLTEHECRALMRIPPGALAAFRRYLDGRWTSGWTEGVTS